MKSETEIRLLLDAVNRAINEHDYDKMEEIMGCEPDPFEIRVALEWMLEDDEKECDEEYRRLRKRKPRPEEKINRKI